MGEIRVRHLGTDRFAIETRGHRMLVDQPAADGGEDTAPTPTELFVAGLASCVAFYARRYLARHDIDSTGLAVRLDYSMGEHPARVRDIAVRIEVPNLPQERRAGLLAVAGHCTVHNTLADPPAVRIGLAEPVRNT